MLIAKNITVGKQYLDHVSNLKVTVVRLLDSVRVGNMFKRGVEYEASNGRTYIVLMDDFQREFSTHSKEPKPQRMDVSITSNIEYTTSVKAPSEMEALNLAEKESRLGEVIEFLEARGFKLHKHTAQTQQPSNMKNYWWYSDSTKNWEMNDF